VAYFSGQTSVGTTATPIDGVLNEFAGNPYRLFFHNNDNTTSVFIGGSDVTTSTGLMLDKGVMIQLTVSPTDVLYAVSSKSGHIISWLTEPI